MRCLRCFFALLTAAVCAVLLYCLYLKVPDPLTRTLAPCNGSPWEQGKLAFWAMLPAALTLHHLEPDSSRSGLCAAVLLAAVLAVVVLSGCKSIAQKVFGSSNEVQEDDTTQWAVLSSDPLVIDGIADTTAKYATARANGALNIVFNGIWSRQTNYFAAPTGTLTVMACGTAEGTQKFKVALWKIEDGGAAYVPDSTYYVKTDGTDYRCTISGLDPAAQYRVTISYDSSRYYLYGLMKVEGIAG